MSILSLFINGAYAAVDSVGTAVHTVSNTVSSQATTATTAANTAASNAPAGPNYGSLLVLIGFTVLLFFFMTRQQSRRAKAHQNLLTHLNSGDEVVTSGGLVGKITQIKNDFVHLALANNIDIVLQKTAVVTVLPKGTLESL